MQGQAERNKQRKRGRRRDEAQLYACLAREEKAHVKSLLGTRD